MSEDNHKAIETKRCTGHCCEGFTFHFSPGEMSRMVRAVKRGTKYRADDGRYLLPVRDPDLVMIRDMIVYKGIKHFDPAHGGACTDSKGEHVYSCSNFDSVERKCKVYDKRPAMCRNFPESRNLPCHYTGCTRVVEKPAIEELVEFSKDVT